MTDSISKKFRWKISLGIYNIEKAHFNRRMNENLEKGIFIDFPPDYPDKPLTTMNIIRYFINYPLKSDVVIKLFEDCNEEDFDTE